MKAGIGMPWMPWNAMDAGNVVKVYNNELLIVDMDEYSRKALSYAVKGMFQDFNMLYWLVNPTPQKKIEELCCTGTKKTSCTELDFLVPHVQVFENPDALLRSFDLEAVLQKLRDSMRQQYPLVRDIFRQRF